MTETITKTPKTKEQTQARLESIAGRLEKRAKLAGAAGLEAAGVKKEYGEISASNSHGGRDSLERDPYKLGKNRQVKLFSYKPDEGISTTIISDPETGQLSFGKKDANDPKNSYEFFDNPNPDVAQVRHAAADQAREMRAAIPAPTNK